VSNHATSGLTVSSRDGVMILVPREGSRRTDRMPLAHRAKILVATESVSAIVVSVVVIAGGVSLLG